LYDWEAEKFNKLTKTEKEKSSAFQSYMLRKKLTPESLKSVMDSEIASKLLKPISSFDMILYIAIGSIVGFLLCISLQAMQVLPKV